ncbi:hypothetical protein DPSP01_008507 [Paraphaeosphaeria sporulosa]|uniref:Meiotically up-regulated protein Msb1/Mug8 domain-containing protein n=1 Tax=Paraphaeosphaeria sporulosa TaxID=1460663 RepID=A0A177BX32_9PLEO|nr:uncharacterized protein CC84DRAFT_1210409 [Paraphaeosphaeria sporulosa]OAF98936.1 hypothetical protein CC84DRAFT_1210409 [Paraphaeosphaeria sporulosa]
MPFFKKVFGSKDGSRAAKAGHADNQPAAPPKPRWEESWTRKEVAPDEIQELIHKCTQELKSRALDIPFLLLPFRPASEPSAARNFVRNFFRANYEGSRQFTGEGLAQELRLAEPLTLCSVMKWCWSRLPGGVVSWDAYELFRIGESDSNFARHAFDTFIPLSVESEARKRVIIDFFDLLAAVAARGKSNGMGGRKLSRMAGWWAFQFTDDGKGFEGGYRTWEKAADAASHLFFAYLRSLAPDSDAMSGINALPRSLLSLLSQTEYPPQAPQLMYQTTTKVVMIVDSVSPTPFALLRRAKNFEYRDDDEALQAFSSYDDTVTALTDECRRVLDCISNANHSVAATSEGSKQDPSWSKFEDMGFSGLLDSPSLGTNGTTSSSGMREFSSMNPAARSRNTDFGRPTTPSWADFLSTGFPDENKNTSAFLSPSAKLPPIGEAARVQSSQSHMRNLRGEEDLDPGELASITQLDLDDTFWWVWMTSLASEETTERKAAFGRCTLIETRIPGAKWLVVEEQVKGASPGQEEGAYIAEKKSMFSWTKRSRLGRRKSTGKKPTASKEPYSRTTQNTPMSKTSIGPDQHARVQAAAARLAQDQRDQKAAEQFAQRRGRNEDTMSTKTNSVLTLQPHLVSEAGPAMKWDKKFGEGAKDKDQLRAQYLGDVNAGKGSKTNLLSVANGNASTAALSQRSNSNRDLPALPKDEENASPSPAPQTFSESQYNGASSSVQPPPEKPALSSAILDDKSGPALDQHPALRKPVPAPAEARPSEEHALVQDPKKSPPTKLKKNKKEGGGGFRKLFGKKKTEVPVAAPVENDDDARLRAIEAARSVSRIDDHSDAREASPTRSVERPLAPPAFPASPAVSAISKTYHEPALQVTPTPNRHQEPEADTAFSRFDQGPMDDMPAFVPDDSDDDDAAPNVPRHAPAAEPEESTPSRRSIDGISEESVDLSAQAPTSNDRWAQIRKNAAERAARLSEEQSRRSHSQSVRTDEGETSGEETIESRVARIKARVAELTGNVEGGPAGQAAARR